MCPIAGPWTVHRVDIRESAVDTENNIAWVPEAFTPAQQLARFHEWGHVKHSPGSGRAQGTWRQVCANIMGRVSEEVTPDPRAVLHIAKMLEENRIDWILWDRYGIDLRQAREVLDWKLMPDPEDTLMSLGACLQLAWTVWASRGLGKGIPNPPPKRAPDPETGEYFDKCWKYLINENLDLAKAMIRGCLEMYSNPTPARRNQVAAELATYFPLEQIEEPKPPPTKPEEQKEQEEAEQQEREHEEYLDKQETGVGGEVEQYSGVQVHDHTANIRRPTMRVARRHVPVPQGINVRDPHRYMMDRSVFGQRLLTEGGLMIDGSGSMRWNNNDMVILMNVLPAIRIGRYSGFGDSDNMYGAMIGKVNTNKPYARICILAKNGRFARFDAPDTGSNDGNMADFEALRLLATWPKPRLWLSDGMVCGGVNQGDSLHHPPVGFFQGWGKLHEMCDSWMKRHDILRVPDRETMHKLLKRQRVTLYRTTVSPTPWLKEHGLIYGTENIWPEGVNPEPITFTL
jgi:hypothetical protein